MRKYLVEFIGTFFLVFVILVSAGEFQPLAIGSILMVMIFAGGHISGAHYNPAVTLAVWIRGKIAGGEVLPYILSQIAGAAVAALAANWMVGAAETTGDTVLVDYTSRALAAELAGTFALAYVVLNVATTRGTEGNSFYGLAIGFTVFACAITLGRFSGGAFNPAVAVGLAVSKIVSWANIWVYLVGCFGGAAVAAVVFKFINVEDKHVPPITKAQ